jgi:hypothetical protein
VSENRVPFERWITVFLGLGMFVIALVGLYYQKVQVEGASGKLISEMNDKIDKMQTAVNERLDKVEKAQNVATLEKQFGEMKASLASLEEKYRAPEQKKVLTDYSSLVTQKQEKLSDVWKGAASSIILSKLNPQPEDKTDLTKKFSFLKEDDRKTLASQFDSLKRTQEMIKAQTPITLTPLRMPEKKVWNEQLWETLKANPVLLVILIFLGVAAARK